MFLFLFFLICARLHDIFIFFYYSIKFMCESISITNLFKKNIKHYPENNLGCDVKYHNLYIDYHNLTV